LSSGAVSMSNGSIQLFPSPAFAGKWHAQWVLNAVLPTPRLEFEMNRDVRSTPGECEANQFPVDDHFGDAHGIPRLNHAILSYSEVRTGAGFDWKVSPIVTFSGEIGYHRTGNFDFYRANIRYHQDGGFSIRNDLAARRV